MLTQSHIQTLLCAVNQVRVYHWQTVGFAEHQAYGGLYDALNDGIDAFFEACMGRNVTEPAGQRLPIGSGVPIDLAPYSGKPDAMAYLVTFAAFLRESLPDAWTPADTDLANTRDDLLAAVNKCLYLLTLS